MDKIKIIEATGYKNEYIEREMPQAKAKQKHKIDLLDLGMLFTSIGIMVGVAFLIVGLV